MRTTGQVAQLLRDEGLSITDSALRYGLLAGHITGPTRDPLGNLLWSDAHVNRARKYALKPRRRGRPRTVNTGGPRR